MFLRCLNKQLVWIWGINPQFGLNFTENFWIFREKPALNCFSFSVQLCSVLLQPETVHLKIRFNVYEVAHPSSIVSYWEEDMRKEEWRSHLKHLNKIVQIALWCFTQFKALETENIQESSWNLAFYITGGQTPEQNFKKRKSIYSKALNGTNKKHKQETKWYLKQAL